MSTNLTPADLALHARLGIPEELLEGAGVRRVNDTEARELLGIQHRGNLAGILYPRVQPGVGGELGYRVRRDHPEMEADRPKNKYMSSIDRSHLFFPPACLPLLSDTSVPVIIVEAEKSALALTAAAARTVCALLPIALGGCWSWKGRIGKTTDATGARVDEHGTLPDFDRVEWRERNVVLLFDANAATNPSAKAARRGLADELTTRGARVRVAVLPVEAGINGPDDYIGAHGDAALFAILEAAKPAKRSHDGSIEDLLRTYDLTVEAVRDITADELEFRLRALREALTGADTLRWESVRQELKKTVKLSAAIVNAALGGRDCGPTTSADSPSPLTDEEPSPEPVNGAALLDETAALIRRHVVLSEPQAHTAALWTAAAHAIDGLDVMPMLAFLSPTPECGKTTAATVMSAIVPRAIMVSSLTPAVLFRLVHTHRPTLIADEVDAWLTDERSELRGVFNAAHDRSGAFIPRCVGDDNRVEMFNVFGPKVIAMIGKPPTTMLSRSIPIALRRKTAGERVEPVRIERLRESLGPLRRRWRRWALDHLEVLRGCDPLMPASLPVNRVSDNWRPLLALADLAGGNWPARARAAALELSGVASADDEPINVALLSDVRIVFRQRGEPESLSSDEIIADLKTMPERPWADWNKGRGLSANQLARKLRDFGTGTFGLHTRKTRTGDKTGQRWHRADFADAWSRYVREEPEHPEHANEMRPQPAILNPEQSALVPAAEIPVQPMFIEFVPGVPGSEPDWGFDSTEDEWLSV